MDRNEEIRRERRQYHRIKRHFIISYYDKEIPRVKHEMSQLKNISLGGTCFVASKYFKPGTKLTLEMKTPYLAGMVHLDGTVLDSQERLANILYETRLTFDPLTEQAEFVLKKIVEHFKEGNRENDE